MTSKTFWRVSSETSGFLFKIRDTVATDTFATLATSLIVAFFFMGIQPHSHQVFVTSTVTSYSFPENICFVNLFEQCFGNLVNNVPVSECYDGLSWRNSSDSSPLASNSPPHPAIYKTASSPLLIYEHYLQCQLLVNLQIACSDNVCTQIGPSLVFSK